MIAKAFIATVAPYALDQRLGGSYIFPSIRIAQSIHETGCLIHPWFNLGGVKPGKAKPNKYWHGDIVFKDTWEIENGERVEKHLAFRSYDSIGDYYGDQDLLFLNTRYKRVRQAQSPQMQAEMLQTCGYATDTLYASKIKNIVNVYSLELFDQEAVESLEAIKQLQKDIAELKVLTKGLVKTGPPKWFIDEFGAHALDGIVSDLTGDENFWREAAIALRLKLSE